ncbi:ExbD/TolR family protein [Sphingopyxis sp. MWB1]|uniref:ExbD/TolR family protein n=1 Tax=Sphingopyxis sp. MWB1 TaxID=1537715 RepID=UPI00051A7AD2|nr:biopolymer transporter ExbD [Sphingopyxis sp. MWB1]
MGMSVGDKGEDAPMSEINTTPLVDIMLVLLIIFLIAVPVVLETVELELPDVAFEPTTTKPENVNISIKGAGGGDGESSVCEVYWGQTPVDSRQLLERGQNKLEQLLEDIGGPQNITEENFPEVHIRGDVNTPYQCIGGVIYTMQFAGFQKIGFISEPAAGSATLGRI